MFAGIVLSEDLFAAISGVATLVVLLMMWKALLGADPVGPRLKSLESRRVRLKAELVQRSNKSRRAVSVGGMRRWVERLRLGRGDATDKARTKLTRAGYRSPDAIVVYLFLRMVLPAVYGFVAVVLVFVTGTIELPDQYKLPAVLVAGLLGFLTPDLYVNNVTARRKDALQMSLPEGLDLMTVCAEAGLSLDAALIRVAKELGPIAPELSFEFHLTAIELTFLTDRQQSFENLSTRTDLPAIRGFVNTLRQTEKYGTPLAHSLRVLSAEYRNERLLKAEEKGARLPAIMTVPMMVFILPTLFVVIMGPAILNIMDSMLSR